jgi:hypothetical protein
MCAHRFLGIQMRPEPAAHGFVQGIKLLLLLEEQPTHPRNIVRNFLCHSNDLQLRLNVHIGGAEAQSFHIQTTLHKVH